jgi:Recombinase zinc beta ribbon domain
MSLPEPPPREALDRPRAYVRVDQRSDFLLSGVIRCGHRGRAYIGMSARGKGGTCHYYACTARQKHGPKSCQGERVPREKLETAVLRQLTGIYRDGPLIHDASPPPTRRLSTSDRRSMSAATPSPPRSPAQNVQPSATSRRPTRHPAHLPHHHARPHPHGRGLRNVRKSGPAWTLFETRPTGVVAPSGWEAGLRAGQQRASVAACVTPAASSPAWLGAQGRRPSADRPGRADAGQGHPRGRRGAGGRAGAAVLGQGCARLGRCGLFGATDPGGTGALRADRGSSARVSRYPDGRITTRLHASSG